MRTAEVKTLFDGHYYEPGEEIPDLGSFVAMPGSNKVRHYEGLSKDFDKLKAASKLAKYDDLQTGSIAICVDTSEKYKYEKTVRDWYKWSGSGGGGSGGEGGTTNYDDLDNQPQINNITLKGNKTLEELGIQSAGDYMTKEEFDDYMQPETEDIDFSRFFS